MHEVGERAGLAVRALGAVALVILVHVLGVLAVIPWEDRAQGRAVVLMREIVFHMALGADQGTLLIARELVPVLIAALQPVLERFGIEAQLHGSGIMAVGAADGFVHTVDLVLAAEFVDVLGPEFVAVLLDPVHHLGGLAVPAGGGHLALAVGAVAVQTVDVHEILDSVGVAAGFVVLVHEGITQPKVFQIGLGVFEALGQGIDIVILVVGDGPLVLGHHLGFVVFLIRGVLFGKFGLEGRNAGFVFFDVGFVGWGLQFRRNIVAAAEQRRSQQRRNGQSHSADMLIHTLPSLC